MKHIFIILALALAVGCSNRKTDDEGPAIFDITATMVRGTNVNSQPLNATAASPHGLFTLKISSAATNFPHSDAAWWLARLSILDSSSLPIYEDEHPYPLWFPFRVRWVTDELIQLESGDIGTVFYEYKETRWVKKEKSTQQSGPAYPPQGVGSADP